jgi:hypothetical protein
MTHSISNDINLIETKKIQLISIIAQVYNLDLLEEIEQLILNTNTDWWTTISQTEQKAIDEGLDDIKAGRVITHNQMQQNFNQRFKDL